MNRFFLLLALSSVSFVLIIVLFYNALFLETNSENLKVQNAVKEFYLEIITRNNYRAARGQAEQIERLGIENKDPVLEARAWFVWHMRAKIRQMAQ